VRAVGGSVFVGMMAVRLSYCVLSGCTCGRGCSRCKGLGFPLCLLLLGLSTPSL